MWAVGRLSLLSRGRTAAARGVDSPAAAPRAAVVAAFPAPPNLARTVTPTEAPTVAAAAASSAPTRPLRPEAPPAAARVDAPAPAAAAGPGLLERVVSRVRRFFSSIFG